MRWLKVITLVVALGGVYLLAWNIIIRYDFLPRPMLISQEKTGGAIEEITVSESPDIIVMRYGFIPMYWSRAGGNMVQYHIAFLVFLGLLSMLLLRRGKPRA